MSKPPNNNEFPTVSWSDSPDGEEGTDILPQVKGYEIVKKLGDGGIDTADFVLQDVFEFSVFLGGIPVVGNDVRRALDRGQRILDLVGNTGGNLAGQCQFLRALDLNLRFLSPTPGGELPIE